MVGYRMSPADKKPVRVRGKRTATEAEKWNHAKQRRAGLSGVHDDISTSSSRSTSSSSHKRKRAARALSAIEKLPVEIIQHIFQLSGNLDLPACSLSLVQQLSSASMFEAFTTSILGAATVDTRAHRLKAMANWDMGLSAAQMLPLARLLNSRFCTWTFLSDWLRKQRPGSSEEVDHQSPLGEEDQLTISRWTQLTIRPTTMLPKKLLTGPWTGEKVSFLSLMVHSRQRVHQGLRLLNRVEAELAVHGLEDAIQHNQAYVCHLLGQLIYQPDVALLRKAVIDCGCNKTVVGTLVCSVYLRRVNLDSSGTVLAYAKSIMLDPLLWSWAERAQQQQDQKGEWLLRLLRWGRRAIQYRDERHDIIATLAAENSVINGQAVEHGGSSD